MRAAIGMQGKQGKQEEISAALLASQVRIYLDPPPLTPSVNSGTSSVPAAHPLPRLQSALIRALRFNAENEGSLANLKGKDYLRIPAVDSLSNPCCSPSLAILKDLEQTAQALGVSLPKAAAHTNSKKSGAARNPGDAGFGDGMCTDKELRVYLSKKERRKGAMSVDNFEQALTALRDCGVVVVENTFSVLTDPCCWFLK